MLEGLKKIIRFQSRAKRNEENWVDNIPLYINRQDITKELLVSPKLRWLTSSVLKDADSGTNVLETDRSKLNWMRNIAMKGKWLYSFRVWVIEWKKVKKQGELISKTEEFRQEL